MAKQLDEKTVLNELHGESVFFRSSPTPAREASSSHRVVVRNRRPGVVPRRVEKEAVRPQIEDDGKKASRPVDHSIDPPTSQSQVQPTSDPGEPSVGQADNQFAGQSVDPMGSELTGNVFDMSPILPRPKAFYIAEKQDEDLDILVKKMSERVKGKVVQKIDRSVATRLIFESIDLTSDETVERLANLLIRRLTSQLTGGPADQPVY